MRFGLVMALFLLAAGPVRAGNITAEFEGMLTLASGIDGADAGTLFSGSYTYDDSAALHLLAAGSGRYDFGAAFPATGFRLVIHTATPVEFSSAPLRDISIEDGVADSLGVVATTGAGGDFRLDLMGGNDLFDSLALTVPDLSSGSGMVQYTNLGAGFVLFMGTLTALSAVPEPSSAALLGLGFAALAAARARSHRRD